MKATRVLFLTTLETSVLQYMVRDLAHGFRRNGCDVEVIRERCPGDDLFNAAWQAKVDRVARWFQPHVIFQMDHLRGENPLMWGAGPVYVSWMQDALRHLFQPRAGVISGKDLIDSVNEKDLILTSFPGLRAKMVEAGYPEKNILHLPVGANFDLFYPETAPPAEMTVGFPCNVGHPATASVPDRYHRRVDPVKWLVDAGVKVRVWGDGWEKIPWAAPFYQGPVKNGPALREAYNSCNVILHANSDTNLHQRVFETVACGRPVLMYALANDGHQDGILRHSLPGVFRFTQEPDILHSLRQCRMFLDHNTAAARAEFLDLARKHNDYKARCAQVLAWAEERL